VTLAYLDPASGSMILSAVVGGVAGVGVFAKQARAKLSRKKKPTGDEATPTAADETTAEPSTEAEPADEPTTVSSDS
jgi:hypothetical protein